MLWNKSAYQTNFPWEMVAWRSLNPRHIGRVSEKNKGEQKWESIHLHITNAQVDQQVGNW